MKILQIHNTYQYRGGEDQVVATEKALLEAHGHRVIQYLRHNGEITGYGPLKTIGLWPTALWAPRACREVEQLIAREKPDIAHVHNTLPLISPMVYASCRRAGIPVVQTLHNFRLACAGANFYRRGKICRTCLGHSPLRALGKPCYRNSRIQTAAVATMLQCHRWWNTWQRDVDSYVALTQFMKRRMIRCGLPRKKIMVKPNSPTTDEQPQPSRPRHVLYMGRLSPEKGVEDLVRAWKALPRVPLKIAGDGPLAPRLKHQLARHGLNQIQLLGHLDRQALNKMLAQAWLVIVPSRCYEGFPLTIAEAFCAGKPVIAPRMGAAAELVSHAATGFLYHPGSQRDLVRWIQRALARPTQLPRMGENARSIYLARYSTQKAHDRLMQIYKRTLAHAAH